MCSVEGCDKDAVKRGWCNAHYLRVVRHGSTEALKRPGNGTVLAWVEAHLDYVGEGCLTWPFVTDKDGRGRMKDGDRTVFAHRFICERVYGPPPSHIHEAAHHCGKGHEACVHPLHVGWKTPVENAEDRLRHGTQARGERMGSARLTEVQVREIYALKGLASQRSIGESFDVDAETIGSIHRRETWGWLWCA